MHHVAEKATSETSLQSKVKTDNAVHQLTHIWEELLAVRPITPDQNYFDLGGDSSLAVQMFAQIEKVFQVKLPVATLYEAPTIEELAQILRGDVAASGWSPLVAIQAAGSRPPFFCFHGAGGNVLLYRELSEHLGTDQPVYGLQSQGLDGSSEPLTRIPDMATLYIEEMRRVQPHGPYFLGGYCMGGTVAFEVAQQLQASGENVALLALFDTMNWSKIPLNVWSKTLYNLQKLFFHAASLARLGFSDQAKFLREKMSVLKTRIPVWRGVILAKLGRQATGAAADAILLGKIWQTNDRASWGYVPQPYPGAITDFRPAKQYLVFDKPDVKWNELARGGQQVVTLPVLPAGMLVEPFVGQLATALRKAMDDAMKNQKMS